MLMRSSREKKSAEVVSRMQRYLYYVCLYVQGDLKSLKIFFFVGWEIGVFFRRCFSPQVSSSRRCFTSPDRDVMRKNAEAVEKSRERLLRLLLAVFLGRSGVPRGSRSSLHPAIRRRENLFFVFSFSIL